MSHVYIPAISLTFLLCCSSSGISAEQYADVVAIDTAADTVQADPIIWAGSPSDGWKEFDRLVDEQKLEAASRLAGEMLDAARAGQDTKEWVRALVRWVQLRMGLHGYETAVRFLKEQPWPDDVLGRCVLNLFYAHSLVWYQRAYAWEINKREKVVSSREVDLKAWTREQIHAEARQAYLAVWDIRGSLEEFPASHLSEFISPNNYPEGVRPFLRDAVSYLFVELLADTNGWSPEQSNEVYRLDLDDLLDGTRLISGKNPPDAGAHPLTRIVAVLGDLEKWHLNRGERDAAFEARLERYRRLYAGFTGSADQRVIRAHLKEALSGIHDRPWWAMGMSVLAGFVQVSDSPDRLVTTHRIATRCHHRFPRSVGGRRCLHIAKSIEAPAFQFEGMKSDGIGQRSLGLSYKNLGSMYFRAYRVDAMRHIESADDYSIFPDRKYVRKLMTARPSNEWSVSLPGTPDFEMHRAYVIPPMERPGLYVVVASAKKGFHKDDNRMIAIPIVIGDLVLITRQEGNRVEVTVRSGAGGRAVPGVDVHLYRYDWHEGHQRVASKRTGKDGSVHFRRKHGPRHFVFARKGQEVALDDSYLGFHRRHDPGTRTASFVYTDRSIFRPGQKVSWKVVVYKGNHGKADYRTAPETGVTVSLIDANHQTVESKTVTTNRFGTASGQFEVPAGRMLGQWRVQVSPGGAAYIRVEEYKRPTFEAKIAEPEEPLRLNRPAKLKGEVKYYFGLPVTNGTVDWRVVREPVYPWWWGFYRWGGGAAASTQTVATGRSSLDEDGGFTVEFTPRVDERLGKGAEGVTYRYSLSADVTDEGGETRSASRSFRLGFVSVEARLDLETAFLNAGAPSEATLVRTDLDGTPAPGEGSWRLVALRGPRKALLPADQPVMTAPSSKPRFRTPGDAMRPRWNPGYRPNAILRSWKDGGERASGRAMHDNDGVAKIELPGLRPGAYRLRYRTRDAFGAKYEMSREFVVAGKDMDLALPLLVLTERPTVKVGGVARLLVVSGLDDQPLTFDVYRDGRRVERRRLVSGRDHTLIEIPVTARDRGGFGIVVSAVRDHQHMQFNQSVFVPWDDRELKVGFSTFRDLLRPGGKETWTVKVTGPSGKDSAVSAAEVLAYMYDRSLDVFAPHYPASPLSVFPNRTQVVLARANLGLARNIWVESHGFTGLPGYPSLVGDRLVFMTNYGIGGPGYRGRGHRYMSVAKGTPMAAPVSARGAGGIATSTVARMEAVAEEAEHSVVLGGDGSMDEDKLNGSLKSGGGLSRDGRSGPPGGPAVEMRSDFSETAFWEPHLITGEDGAASIRFTVPDSVTSWNVWVHAVTSDLKSGSVKKEARTVKDLMVRPYLPRFLREGDRAHLKVLINNASESEMKGKLFFDIIDPDTGESLIEDFGLSVEDTNDRPFTVKAEGGTNLVFEVKAPNRVGAVAFKVTAVSGDFSDGELRPIPVLPGRIHLAQSRFVTLSDNETRVMTFDDMKRDDDPSLIHDQMVVTVDAQLFYQVLSALPYLVNYPYECTEQTLNRFLSTGILSSFYDDYPALGRMAKKMSKRDTRLETWDTADPNRKMTLEEIPWLRQAKGGSGDPGDLLNVLDPRIAKAQRDGALAKLKKSQTSSGGFPWFPGGRPSPWMTLYILHGLSKGLEFKVDVPRDMVRRAWAYMHRHYVDRIVANMMSHDCCWEFITFLNYVISNYPDDSWTGGVFTKAERTKMLDFSFRHWKDHAPYVKGQLALTLLRMHRKDDALLVWDSVMDSARTKKDQGTSWTPEDRGWLWYNDSIETHAFSIRTLMELDPDNSKLDGLVLWVFLNKKLNHWKSTRATSEVIYSLAHYLKATEQMGLREVMDVTIGDLKRRYVFEPDEFTGKKNQILIAGEDLDSRKHHTVTVEKSTRGHAFASATWHFSSEKLPDEARGDYLKLSRTYFKRVKTGKEITLEPMEDGAVLRPGDELEVRLSLRSKHTMEYVHLRDPRGAGFEPVSHTSKHRWDLGLYYYEEVRDSGENFFFERLPQGEYTFKYRVRAATAGTFRVGPATVQPMYAPEFNAYSAGHVLEVGM